MKVSDLVIFGKLGSSDASSGTFTFKLNKNFQTCFLELENFFLKFKDHSVRYVKLTDYQLIKKSSGSCVKLICCFAEDEIEFSSNFHIGIAPEEYQKIVSQDWTNYHLGKKVLFDGDFIGEIEDEIKSSMQRVIVVRLTNGGELLIPLVDHYVKNVQKDFVSVANIEGLIDL